MQVSRVELDGVRQAKSNVERTISRIQHLKEVFKSLSPCRLLLHGCIFVRSRAQRLTFLLGREILCG